MIIGSIDAAPRHTGAAFCYAAERRLVVYQYIDRRPFDSKAFIGNYRLGLSLKKYIKTLWKEHQPVITVMEIAPPNCSWSYGLAIVQTLVFDAIYRPAGRYYLVPSSKLRSLTGEQGKALIREVAMRLVEANGFTIEGKVTSDIADSLIFVLYIYHNLVEPLNLLHLDGDKWELKEVEIKYGRDKRAVR